MSTPYSPIHAPRGNTRTAQGWIQEAAKRMLMNNLDPEVAEKPEELIVYGGRGKAARNWDAYHRIVATLDRLKNDETLLVQSGKPVAVLQTQPLAPRVLIANSNLVPRWATWEEFDKLDRAGLMMYGQMTAGSWIYIGTQGILQGTYETFHGAARRYFNGSLAGTITVTAGLGGMGGAQPLAVKLAGGVSICVEVDPTRIQRRLETRYLDTATSSLDEALTLAKEAKQNKKAHSIGLLGNAAEVLPQMVKIGFVPELVTDQTSSHDPLWGYLPPARADEDLNTMRAKDPEQYTARVREAMAEHVRAILAMQKQGAVAFDYGNNLRAQAKLAGVENAFDYPGFVPEFIRDSFCDGRGPFRWVALSGDPRDIARTDELVLELFPDDGHLRRWIRMAGERVRFQGLPARICWLGQGERARVPGRHGQRGERQAHDALHSGQARRQDGDDVEDNPQGEPRQARSTAKRLLEGGEQGVEAQQVHQVQRRARQEELHHRACGPEHRQRGRGQVARDPLRPGGPERRGPAGPTRRPRAHPRELRLQLVRLAEQRGGFASGRCPSSGERGPFSLSAMPRLPVKRFTCVVCPSRGARTIPDV